MTIQQQIEALKKEFETKLAELEKQAETEEKQGKVWKPKKSENYCCLYGHDFGSDVWADNDVDKARFIRGNVLTKEEAEWEDMHRIVATELKHFVQENDPSPITDEDWGKENKKTKYFIRYDYWDNHFWADYCNTYALANQVYASNCDTLYKAIDHIGEERLKKYYFGVGK